MRQRWFMMSFAAAIMAAGCDSEERLRNETANLKFRSDRAALSWARCTTDELMQIDRRACDLAPPLIVETITGAEILMYGRKQGSPPGVIVTFDGSLHPTETEMRSSYPVQNACNHL